MSRRIVPRPTYANVIASVALFLALGGGTYAALSARSQQKLGGSGEALSKVVNVAPGDDKRLFSLQGIGRISAICGSGATSSGFGFATTTSHSVAMVTDDPGGNAAPNETGYIAGSGHGFTDNGVFSGKGGVATIQLSTRPGRQAKRATVVLSALNGGDPLVSGLGTKCRFNGQAIEQP